MVPTVLLGVISILNVAALVFLVIVLIKQFSKGGVLQGLLGLITCGLWTFIWGWIKHRQFNLTKIMTMWSIAYAASMVIGVVFSGMIGMELAKLMGEAQGDFKAQIQKQTSRGATVSKKVNLPNRRPAAKPNPAASGGAVNSADPEKLATAAMALWRDGRYSDPESAVSHWSGVIKARPDSAEAFNNRGLGHYNAGRYPEAISDYSRAIQLKANYAVAFNNRGNARYQMSQYQEATADYSASLRVNPGYANAYSNRGLANFKLNRQAQACQDFQKACELGSCKTLKWATSRKICQ